MINVVMKRRTKRMNMNEIVRLLRMLRVKEMQQPGNISGEMLQAVDDLRSYLVNSAWENSKDWETIINSPQPLSSATSPT